MFRGMASIDVEIVETQPMKKGKPTVILGFAGPGFIGGTAVMFVARNKNLVQRAHVRSQVIPPMILLIDGQITPDFRIYSHDDEDLLFITNTTMVASENAWPIGQKLLEWFLSKGASSFISIEPLPFGTGTKERPLLGFSTHRKDLSKFGVQPAREGSVAGISACMLDECVKRDIPWTSLFVPTTQVSTVDYGGAAAVIEVLNKMFKLGVDVTLLKQRDEMMRRVFESRMKGERRGLLDSLRRRD